MVLAPTLKNNCRMDFIKKRSHQQVKKQYDGYVQFWCDKSQCIKIAYCGTLMVDHCPAEKLVEHFFEFIKKANLDLKYILHIGMDGPSVNLKFEKLLIDQLNRLINWYLSITHCS